jgi:hypothetical protein
MKTLKNLTASAGFEPANFYNTKMVAVRNSETGRITVHKRHFYRMLKKKIANILLRPMLSRKIKQYADIGRLGIYLP